MHVLKTLLPVFIVVGLGFWLRRREFFSKEFNDGLSKLVYWVALPSLLFYKIATSTYDYAVVGKTAGVMLVGMVGAVGVAYIVAFFMRIKGGTLGSFVHGTIRGNLIYIGLPILIYSFSNNSSVNITEVEALAVLVMAPLIPIYNILSVIVLLASQHKFDRGAFGKMGLSVVTNPLIISSVAGALYPMIFASMPVVMDRVLGTISQSSLFLALLTVGAALAEGKEQAEIGKATISSLIKIWVSLIVGIFVAKWAGLGVVETRIALVYLACPTAISSYVLVDQLGANRKLAASIVVICTLLSVLSLSFVVWRF